MKPPSPQPEALAPHHLRFFALIFDYLLALILLRLVDELTLGRHWDLNPGSWEPLYGQPLWYLGLPLLLLGRDMAGRRSPGKWVTGITLARADDPSLPTRWAARLVRNAPLVLLPVECVLVFLHPHMRRLGDRLAGTVVVADPLAPPLLRRWLVVAILFLGMLLASFLIGPWNMRRSAAFQQAWKIAAGHPGLAEAVGRPVELDDAPLFELSLPPGPEPARVTFQAEGPRGARSVTVVLRFNPKIRRWDVAAVRVETPAAPPPAPVRDAPPEGQSPGGQAPRAR